MKQLFDTLSQSDDDGDGEQGTTPRSDSVDGRRPRRKADGSNPEADVPAGDPGEVAATLRSELDYAGHDDRRITLLGVSAGLFLGYVLGGPVAGFGSAVLGFVLTKPEKVEFSDAITE